MSKLKEIFVYVNDEDVQSFIDVHTSQEYSIIDDYTEKIAFLGSSGNIATHGNIYGGSEIYIGKSSDAPSFAKIIIDNEEQQVEIYSKSDIDDKLSKVSNKYVISGTDNSFNFSDINGNVVAKIDANGIKSIAFIDKDNKEYYTHDEVDELISGCAAKTDTYTKSEIDEKITSDSSTTDNKYVINSENSTFNFTDIDGHVVAKIDADGIHSVGFYDANDNEITYNSNTQSSTSSTATNRFTNKYVFSLCDSLGSGGGWQTTFCTEVGAKPFNQELNGGAELKTQGLTLSCGGAATLHKITFGWDGRPDGLTSGQQRAINFVKQSANLYGDKDYLFLENINDFNFFGDELTDEMIADPSLVDPVMVEETYVYDGQIFSTQVGARDFFYANPATVLNGITPSVNRAITLKCGSKKFKFTIANAATQDGIITITINGQEYIEQVLANTSISDIATQLYAINFVGYDNSKTDDILSITANTVAATDYTVTVTNTCGCNITVEQESTTGNWSAVFTSHDVNDWLDTTKWETNITSMRAIMGLIEYLEQKLPKTHLIYVLMPRFPFKYDAYKKADGTPDEHTYRNLDIIKKFERFLKMQKAVCEFYNLEYIDLAHTMGWNYNNMYTWFGNGTIHWNAYAHEYIGKFLANKLA